MIMKLFITQFTVFVRGISMAGELISKFERSQVGGGQN